MGLEQTVHRWMPPDKAKELIGGLYREILYNEHRVLVLPPGSLRRDVGYFVAYMALSLLSPLQSNQLILSYKSRLQEYVNEYIEGLQIASPLHQQEMKRAAGAINQKITDAAATYPDDATRFGALQKHMEGRLEATVTSAEQFMVEDGRIGRKHMWGTYSCLALIVGVVAIALISNRKVGGIGSLILYGSAFGTVASAILYGKELSRLRLKKKELLETSTTEAWRAFIQRYKT